MAAANGISTGSAHTCGCTATTGRRCKWYADPSHSSRPNHSIAARHLRQRGKRSSAPAAACHRSSHATGVRASACRVVPLGRLPFGCVAGQKKTNPLLAAMPVPHSAGLAVHEAVALLHVLGPPSHASWWGAPRACSKAKPAARALKLGQECRRSPRQSAPPICSTIARRLRRRWAAPQCRTGHGAVQCEPAPGTAPCVHCAAT